MLVRQRPGSVKNVTFITIEDETGIANLVVWPDLYEKQRRIVLTASMLGIQGTVQREGDVIHILAARLFDLTSMLSTLVGRDGDVFTYGAPTHSQGSPLRLESRNFHDNSQTELAVSLMITPKRKALLEAAADAHEDLIDVKRFWR